MEEGKIIGGGLQYVPQIAVQQIIYLDFDGEVTSYNGEILSLDTVEVKDALLTAERIKNILAELNAKYADQKVVFVTERPAAAEYSTIFIGKTSAFDQYGSFAGLAETIDEGNANKTDNAFVMLDSTAADSEIISTIAHETDHLTGRLNHGGEGLQAYAYRYNVSSGITSSGITLSRDSMYVSSGGTATNTTVSYSGRLYVSSGGTALNIVENGGYVYVAEGASVTFTPNTISGLVLSNTSATLHSVTTANHTTVNGGGRLSVSSGGTVNYTTMNEGYLVVYSGGTANSTTVNYGLLYVFSGGTVLNIIENGGYVYAAEGANVTFTPNTISGLVLSYTSATLHSGTMANYTTLNSAGYLHVFSGGTANYTTVNSGGSMRVFFGGTATATTVNYGGSMTVSSGGTATDTTVNTGGRIFVEDEAQINTLILSGGGVTNSSGNVEICDNAVFSGNIASQGGAIYNDGGTINFKDAEFASYTDTVYNTGTITINGDVSFAGNVTLTTNSYGTSVGSLQNNGNVDFNISVRIEDDGVLLNNWELVSGEGSYSVTIDSKQVSGEYQLIGNAATFAEDLVITVRNENGSKQGELTLDMEEPLELRTMSLMLKLNEETNIVSVIVDSEYSEATDREKRETQVKLPDTAFAGMSYSGYTLTQAPDWLTIDPNTGKLSGTIGKITDTATGYGTTEVVITATKGDHTKEHTVNMVVVPENIKGDGEVKESDNANMTDLIADAVSKRNDRASAIAGTAGFYHPQDIAWEFHGLDIKISEVYWGIAVTETDYVITVQGKLNFTIFDSAKSVDERASLTVDFSGENTAGSVGDYTGSKYIRITTPHDFSSVDFDIVGELQYRNLSLSDGLFLTEGVISVDTVNNIWSGTAEVEFLYFDKTITVEYNVVKKQVDTLTIELSDLDIAVGTTGLILDSIKGGVENLSDADDKPSAIVGGAGFHYGKEVEINGKNYNLATLDLEVSITKRSITGIGNIEILNGIIYGNVTVTGDWKDGSVAAQGSLTLAKLITAQGALKIDCRGNISCAVQGMVDFAQYGIGFAASANVMFNFTNDNDKSNDYYAAWLTQKICGIEQNIGIKFALDGSWTLLGTAAVSELASPLSYGAAGGVLPVTKRWDLTGVSGVVLITAQWESGDAEFLLSDGKGNNYTLEDIAQRSDMEVVESMSHDNNLVIAIKDPAEGTWALTVSNGTNVNIGANTLNGGAAAAAPEITATAGNERNIIINWQCSELPEGAQLCIYYDTDNSGNDGSLVAQIAPESTTGSYSWSVPDSFGGTLHFYGVLSAPDMLPSVGSYTSALQIERKKQLIEIDSDAWNYVEEGFYVQDSAISSGGILEISGGAATGNISIADGAELILDDADLSGAINLAGFMTVKSQIDASNVKITLDLTDNDTIGDYLIDNISMISNAQLFTVKVSADQSFGTYKLAQRASSFAGTLSVGDGSVNYGQLTVNGKALNYNGVAYQLIQESGNLTLTVGDVASASAVVKDDLDGNGLSDVILRHNAGFCGAYLTTENGSIKWGNLTNVKNNTQILGTGNVFGSAESGQDIFFQEGKYVGAWLVDEGKITGYQKVWQVDSDAINVLGLGDFNGDGGTDLLLRHDNGTVGCYRTDGTGWKGFQSIGKEWEIAGIGDFNGDGRDDLLLKHDAGFAGTWLTNENGSVTWKNLDNLKDGLEIAGVGDFNGDGVDDVLIRKGNWVGAWLVEEGSVDSFMGIKNNLTSVVEQIGDFNGDGIDDLRIRANKDLGVLYVTGADTTQWQYIKSVGTEWKTTFAAQVG